ncbi:hypothetical protein [Nocardiopsis sp. NPDC006832]|uniref:hypothetical protein n=1 Tax=Nocardiopsis sp. NPDC006832 TaxID=3157188 RepID=UPI0033DCF611
MNFLYALSGLKPGTSVAQEVLVQLITIGVVGLIIHLFVSDRPLIQILGMAAILVYSVGRVVVVISAQRADRSTSDR